MTGAATYVATVDRSFFDSFKEASALAHHLRDAHQQSDSALIRDIASGHERPFGLTASPDEIEQSTVATLEQAVATLTAKAPDELPAYKQLVLDVAESVAEAAKGVSKQENTALDRVRAALDAAGQYVSRWEAGRCVSREAAHPPTLARTGSTGNVSSSSRMTWPGWTSWIVELVLTISRWARAASASSLMSSGIT